MTEPVFDPERPVEFDPLLNVAPAMVFTEPPPPEDGGPPLPEHKVHRLDTQLRNYEAATACGVIVPLARTTQDWPDVTCGNCSRSAPEG